MFESGDLALKPIFESLSNESAIAERFREKFAEIEFALSNGVSRGDEIAAISTFCENAQNIDEFRRSLLLGAILKAISVESLSESAVDSLVRSAASLSRGERAQKLIAEYFEKAKRGESLSLRLANALCARGASPLSALREYAFESLNALLSAAPFWRTESFCVREEFLAALRLLKRLARVAAADGDWPALVDAARDAFAALVDGGRAVGKVAERCVTKLLRLSALAFAAVARSQCAGGAPPRLFASAEALGKRLFRRFDALISECDARRAALARALAELIACNFASVSPERRKSELLSLAICLLPLRRAQSAALVDAPEQFVDAVLAQRQTQPHKSAIALLRALIAVGAVEPSLFVRDALWQLCRALSGEATPPFADAREAVDAIMFLLGADAIDLFAPKQLPQIEAFLLRNGDALCAAAPLARIRFMLFVARVAGRVFESEPPTRAAFEQNVLRWLVAESAANRAVGAAALETLAILCKKPSLGAAVAALFAPLNEAIAVGRSPRAARLAAALLKTQPKLFRAQPPFVEAMLAHFAEALRAASEAAKGDALRSFALLVENKEICAEHFERFAPIIAELLGALSNAESLWAAEIFEIYFSSERNAVGSTKSLLSSLFAAIERLQTRRSPLRLFLRLLSFLVVERSLAAREGALERLIEICRRDWNANFAIENVDALHDFLCLFLNICETAPIPLTQLREFAMEIGNRLAFNGPKTLRAKAILPILTIAARFPALAPLPQIFRQFANRIPAFETAVEQKAALRFLIVGFSGNSFGVSPFAVLSLCFSLLALFDFQQKANDANSNSPNEKLSEIAAIIGAEIGDPIIEARKSKLEKGLFFETLSKNPLFDLREKFSVLFASESDRNAFLVSLPEIVRIYLPEILQKEYIETQKMRTIRRVKMPKKV